MLPFPARRIVALLPPAILTAIAESFVNAAAADTDDDEAEAARGIRPASR